MERKILESIVKKIQKMKKKYLSLVIFSGGMDSSICLGLAKKKFGAANVLALTYHYGQRHEMEVRQSKKIAKYFGVDHKIMELDFLSKVGVNALTNKKMKIKSGVNGSAPNTMVMGRNGLFAMVGSMVANEVGATSLWMGVMGLEGANSGYRDCSPEYIKLMENIIRIDIGNLRFNIYTPLIKMTKKETMGVADKLGVLPYLLDHTVSCYKGIMKKGCGKCPACKLRNEGIKEYLNINI